MAPNRKVLHLASAECEWETAAHIAMLAAALREKGWSSAIVTPEHSRLDELAEASGVEVIHYAIAPTLNPLAWMELSGVVKKSEADLVHVHDPDAARMAARAGWLSSLKGMVTSRHDLNTPPLSAEYGDKVWAVICPSQAVENAFPAAKAAGKTRVIPVGANLTAIKHAVEDRADIRTKYRDAYCPRKEKPLFLLDISPLDGNGGHAELLEAFPEIAAVLPQTHLFIMGEGEERPDLERQIRITALENDVTILDPDRAYARLMAAADVFVSPGAGDVAGFMLQTAMAAGRAVAVSNAGCHGELVDDGKNGVLVGETGVGPLKEAVLGLLQERTRREHLGRMAQVHAAKQFDILELAGKVAEVYDEQGR